MVALIPAQAAASARIGRFARPAVVPVVQQHLDDCIGLRNTRTMLVRSPRVRLHQLLRADERIAAHLSGVVLAGADGARMAVQSLATPDAGSLFTCSCLALLDEDAMWFGRLTAIAEVEPDAFRGTASALGWLSSHQLKGKLAAFVGSRNPFERSLMLAACALHRIDPGTTLGASLADADPRLATRALRTAAVLGRIDLLPMCVEALDVPDRHHRYQAARTSILLGNRHAAVAALEDLAVEPGLWQREALRLIMKLVEPARADEILVSVAHEPPSRRMVIEAIGMSGLTHYIPWLIDQMSEPPLARLAADAFTALTGADLTVLDLEAGDAATSTNLREDTDAMDVDDGFPYPDVEQVGSWWNRHAARFDGGARWFLGEAVSARHCIDVLGRGTQPQRGDAAEHLALLRPGTALFNIAAPAWRQRRLLQNMAA